MAGHPEYNRGFICGVVVACSIIRSSFDCEVEIEDCLANTGITRAVAKSAGADPYDLKILKGRWPELRRTTRRARAA